MAQFKLPKVPGKLVTPTFPKAEGEGYRRPDDGNDTNVGLGHFEARIRPLADLGSGLRPQITDKPPPLWTQFLAPKEYNWVYSEVLINATGPFVAGVSTAADIQQVDNITVPGTLALIILEWTPILMRPKAGSPTLREYVRSEEYSQQLAATLAIGGRSPLASSFNIANSLTNTPVSGTRFMNVRAFSMNNTTFPVVVYGSAGESVTITFTYNNGLADVPDGTSLVIGSITLGLSVPISSLDRIYEYLRLT